MTHSKFKGAITLLAALLIFGTAPAQEAKKSLSEPTSKVLKTISKHWKADTLGLNGYRTKVFDAVRKSKTDSITKKTLFELLGKPNKIWNIYSGVVNKDHVVYVYYTTCMFWDGTSYMGGYISFVFDDKETKLLYLNDGDICF